MEETLYVIFWLQWVIWHTCCFSWYTCCLRLCHAKILVMQCSLLSHAFYLIGVIMYHFISIFIGGFGAGHRIVLKIPHSLNWRAWLLIVYWAIRSIKLWSKPYADCFLLAILISQYFIFKSWTIPKIKSLLWKRNHYIFFHRIVTFYYIVHISIKILLFLIVLIFIYYNFLLFFVFSNHLLIIYVE